MSEPAPILQGISRPADRRFRRFGHSGRRARTAASFRSVCWAPIWTSWPNIPTRWKKLRDGAGTGRRRFHALAAQAGGASRDRPRSGQRPGHPGADDRQHARTCWSAGRSFHASRRGPSNTTSGCGPTSNFAPIRKTLGALTVPSPKAGLVQLTQPGQAAPKRAGRARSIASIAQRTVTILANPDRNFAQRCGQAARQRDRQRDEPAAAVRGELVGGQAKMLGETATTS